MTRLIAIKPMSYNTRRLVPGDAFEASSPHARVFVALRKARPEATTDAPPADVLAAAKKAAPKKRGRKKADPAQ